MRRRSPISKEADLRDSAAGAASCLITTGARPARSINAAEVDAWRACEACGSVGSIYTRSRRRRRTGGPPPRKRCETCAGRGIVAGAPQPPTTNATVAIAGGGVGGLALALALQHRSIKCVVYERDADASTRKADSYTHLTLPTKA